MTQETPPTRTYLDAFLWQHELAPAPWHGWPLFIGIAIALVGYVVSSLIVGYLLNRLGLINGLGTGAGLFATQIAMIGPVLIVAAMYGKPLRNLGFRSFRWFALVELLIALGIAFSASILWGLFLLLFDKQAQPPILPMFGEGMAAFGVAYLVGAIIAPVVEEVVFRGFLFGGLLGSFSAPVAMIISAAIFAGLHLQPLAFPVLFVLGLLLALVYYRSGSLWLPILMHFIINSVGLCGQFALQNMPPVT